MCTRTASTAAWASGTSSTLCTLLTSWMPWTQLILSTLLTSSTLSTLLAHCPHCPQSTLLSKWAGGGQAAGGRRAAGGGKSCPVSSWLAQGHYSILGSHGDPWMIGPKWGQAPQFINEDENGANGGAQTWRGGVDNGSWPGIAGMLACVARHSCCPRISWAPGVPWTQGPPLGGEGWGARG